MSKQDETLVKAFLDAKAAVQDLIAEAKRIDNSLNLCWSAYTKRELPRDLGGNGSTPSYSEVQEADEYMASGGSPARRVPPPRRKKT